MVLICARAINFGRRDTDTMPAVKRAVELLAETKSFRSPRLSRTA